MERFYFQYKMEALPYSVSIQEFCVRIKVLYNIFSKWYEETRREKFTLYHKDTAFFIATFQG